VLQCINPVSPMRNMKSYIYIVWFHIRNTLFLILHIYGAIDIDIILYGNENLTEAQNVDIFTAVQMFRRNSHRFD